MSRMFDTSNPAKTVKPSPKSTLDKQDFPVPGLAFIGKARAIMKALKAVCDTKEGVVKTDTLSETFAERGAKVGHRPENYQGRDGTVTGSMQLKDRSSASPLKDEEKDALDQAGISYETFEISPAHFRFNEAYAKPETMEEIGNQIDAAREAGFVIPEDLFTYYAAETKALATERTIAAVYETKDKDLIKKLLPIVACIAIGPTKIGGELTREHFDEVLDVLFPKPKTDAVLDEFPVAPEAHNELMEQLKKSLKEEAKSDRVKLLEKKLGQSLV